MDSTEKYIKMCEKAVEIQKMWDFSEGDFYLHKFLDKNVEEERFKWMVGNKLITVLCDSCNVKDSYGDCYIGEYTPKDENVWLPRQDQLQEIYRKFVEDELGQAEPDTKLAFLNFVDWMHEQYIEESFTCVPTNNFSSGEQLWLAFVMQECYEKKWNGEDWVTASEL